MLNEAREAAENLLTIKQFLIEDQQQQMDVMESELEAKTMLVDTMQQGSVDARHQKQFLEGVVLQADGVIGGMVDTVEQKDGYIGKVSETLANEKRRLRLWGKSHSFRMLRIMEPSDKYKRALYHVIRCKTVGMDNATKKIKSAFPKATIVFDKDGVPNSVNMYDRLKATGIVKYKNNKCSSRVSEDKLIQILNQLYNIVKPELAICVKN